MKLTQIILTSICLALAPAFLSADQVAHQAASIRITGRKAVTISQSKILLSDVADVESALSKDDETVIALKKIEIAKSPLPGQETTLAANQVLDKLQQAGVALSQVVYVLPRVIKINRASRVVTLQEVETAIKQALLSIGRDVSIRGINYQGSVHVTPQVEKIVAEQFINGKPSQMAFIIRNLTSEGEESNFEVTVQIDEWANIPIASRQLKRGNTISPGDIMMAKLNISALPTDTFQQLNEVVGQEVVNDISYGETFRKGRLAKPILVSAGSQVMIYKIGVLEASATGTALEAGAIGQEIKVRNDSSKKVILGKVLSDGNIGVGHETK
jgi:flagellar basal body P-ring formation protein FlgA